MILNNSITVNIQGVETTLDHLNVVTIDNSALKFVMVRLHPAAKPLMLWRGAEYEAAGDYTQAQVEARVLEVLGEDLRSALQNLFSIEIL